MIRTLIADDHAVVRAGLRRLLDDAHDIIVVAEAATGQELLATTVKTPCDVVVMDLAMPGLPSLEVIQELRRRKPRLPILILTMYPEDQYAVRALSAGAAGYLHKAGPPEELLKAIRTVSTGRRYISPEVAACLAAYVDAHVEKPPHERLSNREYQILRLIAAGRDVGAIAAELCLSVKTISTFRRRVLDKLKLRNNAELTRYAIEHNLAD